MEDCARDDSGGVVAETAETAGTAGISSAAINITVRVTIERSMVMAAMTHDTRAEKIVERGLFYGVKFHWGILKTPHAPHVARTAKSASP
jgi:hypothetical protein